MTNMLDYNLVNSVLYILRIHLVMVFIYMIVSRIVPIIGAIIAVCFGGKD